MQQTILPQTSGPGMPQDAAGSKAATGSRSADNGESRFDQVSRSEQDRLEQKRAERRDQAESARDKQQARQADAKAEADNRNTRTNDASEAAGQPGTDQAQASNDAGAAAEEAIHHPPEAQAEAVAPLTFANLQSLVLPASAAANAAVNGEAAAFQPLMNGGLPGKPMLAGVINGQGASTPGMTPASQLSDLLAANVTTETVRPADPASLLAAPRFQASMDQAAQQALQQGKLTPDAALPLRGYATTVDVPVGQAEWGDKVMGKLSWLTARNMQVAEIHLTPPDMGPMEVKVRVQNDQAAVTVHAANPVVREQLEQHSHRLRDMLGEQGLSLSQFDVSDQPGRQTGEQSGDSDENAGSGHAGGSLATHEAEDQGPQSGQLDLAWKGEVDIFA